jgi:fructosamine-3-kinase
MDDLKKYLEQQFKNIDDNFKNINDKLEKMDIKLQLVHGDIKGHEAANG